jgi:methyl-accepting chemotaxis protein
MIRYWKKFGLQAKFVLTVGFGLFALAAATVAVIDYLEYSAVEQKLWTLSEKELNSLNSLVDSVMKVRFDDPQNVAIKVFDGWFSSRNKEYGGKLWSVWGPSTADYMARTSPQVAAKTAQDAIDEEALKTGRPVGRFVGDSYRVSIPIVWGVSGVTKQEACIACHESMGMHAGDVLTVFSSSVPTTADLAQLRQHVLWISLGALLAISAILAAIWLIFGRVVAQPISKIAGILLELTNNRIVDVPYGDRQDEIGAIARATEVFKQSVAEKIVNLRVRCGLDAVRSNVMIADERYDIIYMNTSLQQMMQEAEAELRKTLPSFDAAKLIGASMDMFHGNPAQQRAVLDTLTGTHEAHIAIGSQKFHLVANNVVDAHGKRAGTVVEWKNETVERAIEAEVDGLVRAAVAGDFAHRVPLDGKKDFMLTLAGAMNSLCENTGSALHDMAAMMSALAEGDLTQRITADYHGMFGKLKVDANTMADRIASTIGEIKAAAQEVTSASAEISTSTTDLSQRTEEQAASLEQTSASMEEIAATVRKNAEHAQAADESATGTRQAADRGGQVVAKAVEAMAKIEDASRRISDIIGVIDEIARQTNLLALNAAVEAARAGDAGRGFAVVASEVRSLAQRSSQAAKDIKDLITNSNGLVTEGVALVNRAGASLNEIVESIKSVATIVADIANASAEQSKGIEQINLALAQMDEVTQQNSALVEENAATAKTLEQQAEAMDQRVAFFKLDEPAAAEPPARQSVVAMPARGPAAKPQPAAAKRDVATASRGAQIRRTPAAGAVAANSNSQWKNF